MEDTQLEIEEMKMTVRERYVPFLDATLRKMTKAMNGDGFPVQRAQMITVQGFKNLLLSPRRWTINDLQTCDQELSKMFTLASEEPNWWQNPPHRRRPDCPPPPPPRITSLSTANRNPRKSPKPNNWVTSIVASIESKASTSQQPNEGHRNILSQSPIYNNETCENNRDNSNNNNRNPRGRKSLSVVSVTPKLNNDTSDASSPAFTSQEPQEGFPTECIICFESPIDTVLYKCGHMCTCFVCATKLREGSGQCPVCRAKIKKIIRVYRS